jgi:hypothetical protein
MPATTLLLGGFGRVGVVVPDGERAAELARVTEREPA